MADVDFSLVVSTRGRVDDIEKLFESLQKQLPQTFELILVDQNDDDILDDLVEKFSSVFPIKHHKVEFRGPGRGRAYGMRIAEGRIVAWPDDDCIYEEGVLEKVSNFFNENPEYALFSAACYDIDNRDDLGIGNQRSDAAEFSRINLYGIEFTLFFNLKKIDVEEHPLDEDFGFCAKYRCSEGTDYVFSLMKAGFKGRYDPSAKIYHKTRSTQEILDKSFNYAFGEGASISKHLRQGDLAAFYHFVRKMIVAPVTKILMSALLFRRVPLIANTRRLSGIWSGFYSFEAK
tara:strand:- start:310 stop:1176 length:867 start_codon:yes stop_codon:yes gene_type:complete